ncbi:helix-turn-helix transcriptional regulator [Oceanobacillus sp. FSL W7-1309]|uniref:helix-turn-helix transcriptional regulator n=1 Tax=Oceanobacillus sp. FSL W7-1309 TaxID=2954539 RepID=UPI0040407F91
MKFLNGCLVEKRKEKKLTQQEIADKIGVSRQYYNDIENEKRSPSVGLAQKIGDVLGIDWTIFFTN